MATGTIKNSEFYHAGDTVNVSGSYFSYVNTSNQVVTLIDLKKYVDSVSLTIDYSQLAKTFAVIGTSLLSNNLTISSVEFVSYGQIVIRLSSNISLTPYIAGCVGITGTITFR